MRVERIEVEHGSRVEPPFDHTWDDFTKLQWQAAVVEYDTGLSVSVEPANVMRRRFGKRRQINGLYNVRCGNSSSGPFNDDQADSFLFGISVGAQEAGDG
jgi:hypothetical protein